MHIHALGAYVHAYTLYVYVCISYPSLLPCRLSFMVEHHAGEHGIVTVSVDSVLENAPLMSAGPLLQQFAFFISSIKFSSVLLVSAMFDGWYNSNRNVM